jgi:hypothetical protein
MMRWQRIVSGQKIRLKKEDRFIVADTLEVGNGQEIKIICHGN